MAKPKIQPSGDVDVAATLVADALPNSKGKDALAAADQHLEPEISGLVEETVPPIQSRARRFGGFFSLFFGGVSAAALGFGLARYVVPEGWPLTSTIKLETRISEQAGLIASLGEDLAGLKADFASRPSTDPAIAKQVSDLDAAVGEAIKALDAVQTIGNNSSLEPRIVKLEARLDNLEKLPLSEGGVSSVTISAISGDLTAIKAEVAAQKAALANAAATAAEVSSAQMAEVKASVNAATLRAALAQIHKALESGDPYASFVIDVDSTGHAVPAALLEMADTGVPTLVSLQDSFPQAARAALDASLRAAGGETITDRLTAFLRAQTGARSLVPLEGTDPDAILSRAEAALQKSDLKTALTEISTIPTEGQAALAEWVVAANRRMQATDAYDALAATLAKE